MTTQVFYVRGMHCSACVLLLEGIQDELDGVARIRANYQKREMEVEYDEARVSAAQIVAAAKRHGYDARPV